MSTIVSSCTGAYWVPTAHFTSPEFYYGSLSAASSYRCFTALYEVSVSTEFAFTVTNSNRTESWYRYSTTVEQPQSLARRLREMIKARVAPVVSSRYHTEHARDGRERRARETLRQLVGADQYQRFLKKGFVTVRAKSNKIYQIFAGHQRTRVYENGRPLEELCVVLRGDFPPTDVLITRLLIVMSDEQLFRSLANVSAAYLTLKSSHQRDTLSLLDVYRSIKKVA